jgi:choline dehydrogenase-like flavoprotein
VGCTLKGVWSESLTVNSDHYEEHIQVPQFIGDDIGSIYDWNVTTTPQTQLDGAARPLPLGRAVGGGSIINGMVWNRGNQDDYNSWEFLGNPGWTWNDLLPYFKKASRFGIAWEYTLIWSSSQRPSLQSTIKEWQSSPSHSILMSMDALVRSLSATRNITGLSLVRAIGLHSSYTYHSRQLVSCIERA